MDESFKNASRISETCFIRDRKISFTNTMVFTLRSAYRTLSVEADEFFQRLCDTESPPSKQAISQARLKISHSGFQKINDAILETYYEERYKTYKGYRLLAADGSQIQLPTGEEITKEFGTNNNQPDSFNSGRSLMIYDVLNNMIVGSKLYPAASSERSCLVEQIESMYGEGKQKRDLIIADRGFPSLPLLVRMKQAQADFLIRYNGEHFLREMKAFATSKKSEQVVEVSLREPGSRQEGGELQELLAEGAEPIIKLRIVKVRLETGEIEYLVTSILDKMVLTKHDLQKLYHLRWDIEEQFKSLKNTIELENFSSKTVETVLQEYYSKMVISNLHSTLVQEAQKELNRKVKQKSGEKKYRQYRINENVSYGLVRNRITELFGQDNGNWEEAYDYLLEAVQRNPLPIRPDRHYERKKKYIVKFPITRRRAI